MSVESDVRAYLVAQLTNPPVISIGRLPAEPDDVIVVKGTGGPQPELVMGPAVVERTTIIQILVRGPKGEYAAVETLMQTINTLLQALGTTVIGARTYDMVTATVQPLPLPVDRNERPMWTCSYELSYTGA